MSNFYFFFFFMLQLVLSSFAFSLRSRSSHSYYNNGPGTGHGHQQRRPTASAVLLQMAKSSRAFNTFVNVDSNYEANCALVTDNSGKSLSDYMKLPVEQYVCLEMPLGAKLERVGSSRVL